MSAKTLESPWSEHRRDLLVACPSCGSTAKQCKRPSEWGAAEWHVEREDAYAKACGCVGCLNWLAQRKKMKPLTLFDIDPAAGGALTLDGVQ